MKAARALKSLLFNEGPFAARVNGHSMFPFIRNKETVTIAPAKRTLKPGCIYLYISKGNTCKIHRFIKKMGNRAVFAGDNSNMFEFVNENEIIGQVLKEQHWSIRKISVYLNTMVLQCNCRFLLFLRKRIHRILWRFA